MRESKISHASSPDPYKVHKPLVKSSGPRLQSPENKRSRNQNLSRASSTSFLAEHNPDIRVLYDEYKDAMIQAKESDYHGEAKLVDVLMNLHCFPSSWNESTQVIQFLSQSK